MEKAFAMEKTFVYRAHYKIFSCLIIITALGVRFFFLPSPFTSQEMIINLLIPKQTTT